MLFKHLRPLICSDLILVIGDTKLYNVSLDLLDDRYDNFEVIGIRSDYYDYIPYVIVSLKEPAVKGNPYNKTTLELIKESAMSYEAEKC